MLDTLAESYRRDGFVVVEDVFDAVAVDKLRAEATAIVAGERGRVVGTELLAGDGGRDERLAQVLAIHFPHKASALMRDALADSRIIDLLQRLLGPDIKAMQSMLFVKNAGKPGQAWHQDEHFIPTRDRSLVGVWIALDDATIDNGCMWMHPGSHEPGILWPMKPHADPRFDSSQEAFDFPYDPDGGVALEVKAGSVALFNGYTLHRSLDNRRPAGFRRALVNHYMNARSLLPWRMGMPPQAREDYRDIVLVAGRDPYAAKGVEEIAFPFIRPEDPAQGSRLLELIQEHVAAR